MPKVKFSAPFAVLTGAETFPNMHLGGLSFVVLGFWSDLVTAQFPPTPVGVTVLESHVEDGARISYKEGSNSS